ncbi:MAG: cysteine desulfurase NifS [Endomicrobiaceae bacterium]|jgi:cysteine desulfurase|nr:cysteine desulfurase NifS [Endomicrobiaceae bacterium]MDD3729620.1 cysteine desulfurase NifS [Endomicrobiaceae bacterium]MDD4165404.1 cysteine desulfurase NifS [Endomicrobiaceae bacterium]
MKKRKVYLDNSATTYTRKEAVDAMMPYFYDIYGNASSVHKFGQDAKNALTDARIKFAELINAQYPDEIIFTSCGTESDNMAIMGVLKSSEGKHIIISSIEHHAVLHTCGYLEKNGYKVDYIPVDSSGKVMLNVLKEKITDETAVISIMHANNEIGVIEPIEEISQIVSECNKNRKFPVIFHTDAVQTAGKIKLDVQKLGVDLLSVSAHKFYGPKGIGILYVKKGTKISPILHGGHHEHGLKPGTENIASIIGMTKALELANGEIEKENQKYNKLREKLKNGIIAKIPQSIINTDFSNSVPNVLNVSFKSIEGESLLLMLDMEGIAVSTGSACASGSTEPSHVLQAIGLDPVTAQGAIRFSLGKQNTEEDIDYVLEVLPKMVEKVRKMSPVWNNRQD